MMQKVKLERGQLQGTGLAKRFCENCFYRGDESEFLAAADFCLDCMGVHSACPKCKAGFHSVHVIE
jgi:hypothetical protein